MIYSQKQAQKKCNISKLEIAVLKKLKYSSRGRWMIDAKSR
jgi:hypothetical protein